MFSCKAYSNYLLHTEHVFFVGSFGELSLYKSRVAQNLVTQLTFMILKTLNN